MSRSVRRPSLAAAMAVAMAGFASGQAVGQGAAPPDIVGIWAEDDGRLTFEVFEVAGTYGARIIHGDRLMEPDSRTFKADTLNPDLALRGRSLNRVVFLSHLRWNAQNHRWEGGSLYDGASGRTYSAQVSLVGERMELRGYLGTPLLGQTVVLRRVP